MNRDVRLFIEDILDSIQAIEQFSVNLTRIKLDSDRLRQSAIIREIEIIGGAVRNLTLDFRKRYPNILWKDIVGSRDKISHSYFKIDLDIIWEIITCNLPVLKKQIEKIKKDLEP